MLDVKRSEIQRDDNANTNTKMKTRRWLNDRKNLTLASPKRSSLRDRMEESP